MQVVKACMECGGKGKTVVEYIMVKKWTQPIVVHCIACKGRGTIRSEAMIIGDGLFS